ncbi:glutathione peroxidase [Micromonosporaceae bacterium DT55]|uniref:glutathione peroxidase n=1 Tax=Melissospora conviva TaxID=3388432 RepID=UPI003C263EA7
MSIFDTQINTLDGEPFDLAALRGQALLIVNVASKCGLTPQYAGLQALATAYADRGLTVLGVPCNQFMGQEPGTPEEIAEFCDVNYGVSFPLTEKVDVNSEHRHPLYAQLVPTADAEGRSGDIQWNFEKFLVAPDGTVAARFGPRVEPQSAEVVAAIEEVLPR